jgi:hypothetical protein
VNECEKDRPGLRKGTEGDRNQKTARSRRKAAKRERENVQPL